MNTHQLELIFRANQMERHSQYALAVPIMPRSTVHRAALAWWLPLLLAALFLVLTTINAHAQDAAQVTPASAEQAEVAGWYTSLIDGSNNFSAGASKSIVAGSDGASYVSYYDGTAQDLRVAIQVAPGQGNCGTDNAWVCSVVDADGINGEYNAVAINPLTGLPAIAYSAQKGFLIRYAVASSCTAGACQWTISPVQQMISNHYVEGVDLVFDSSDNRPHIAYTIHKPSAVDNWRSLHYARQVNSGGNCGNTGWQCDTIDETKRAVTDFALGVTQQGRGRIIYSRYEVSGNNITKTELLYAAYTINSGNCGPKVSNNFTWTCTSLLTKSGYSPYSVDMAMNGSEPHVIYNSQNEETVNYLTLDFENLAGNCGPSNQWHCTELEHVGGYVDVAIGLNGGTPAMAYSDYDDTDHTILKAAIKSDGVGNCGQDGLFFGFTCETVDNGVRVFIGTHDVDYPAINYDANRKSWEIAYSDKNDGDLRFAEYRQPAPKITGLTPISVTAGAPDTVLTIDGSGFDQDSMLFFGDVEHAKISVTAKQITVNLSAAELANAGSLLVKVFNPSPGAMLSNEVAFTIVATQPPGGDDPGGGNPGGATINVFLPLITN